MWEGWQAWADQGDPECKSYGSVTECLSSMREDQSSIPSTPNKTKMEDAGYASPSFLCLSFLKKTG